MNPLLQTGREIDSGLSRIVSRASVLILICAVALSWLLVTPAKADGGGFLVMVLWFLILAVALGASLLMWRSSPVRRPRDHSNYRQVNTVTMMIAATVIVVLGMVTAFLSGDKFDALRAAAVAGVLIIMNYPRRIGRGRSF